MERRLDSRQAALATTCGIHVVQDGLYATIYVLLPVVTPIFGLSYVQVGTLRAAFSSAMTLLQIPSGFLSEHIGERTLLVGGLVAAGLGYLLLASSAGTAMLAAGLFMAGAGAAFQHAPSSSLIAGLFPSEGRRAALGAYNASGDVGKLAFTGLFSAGIGVGLAWNHTVAGLGLVAVVSALAVAFALHRLDVGGPPVPSGDHGGTEAGLGWGIRSRSGFSTLTAIVFLDLAVQSGFLTFVAFLMTEKAVPTGLAAFAVVLTLAGGVLGKLGCGFLAERLGPMPALQLVQALTALGIVAVLLLPATIAFFVLPLLGVVLQGSSTITYGSVSDLVHRERQSRGFAFIYSVSSAAGITGPIIFGLVSDTFGLTAAIAAMAGAAVLCLPLSIVLRAHTR
jgi:MFS family permease